MRISGSVFVVTGGSSGLGAATVQALVQRGARCINMDMQSPLYDNIPADSVFWTGKTDITDEQQVVDALKRGMDRLGGSSWSLRGVVNCAGFGTPGLTLKANGDPMPLEKFTRDINVNIVGSFNIARLVGSHMAKNTKPDEDGERGIIILTASIAGIDTQPRMIAYSVGKAGTAALTLPLARDLSPFGIRVMSIAPGTFATPLFGTMPAHVRESFGAAVVWPKRVGKPPEYASLACHMIENRYLNGEVIRLDGGFRVKSEI